MLPETTTLVPIAPTSTTPLPEETYSPFTALIISLVSFLLVFLILCLLYIHFYQVGRQIKNWIKGSPEKGAKGAPMRPPRRNKERPDLHDMYEINLKGESAA